MSNTYICCLAPPEEKIVTTVSNWSPIYHKWVRYYYFLRPSPFWEGEDNMSNVWAANRKMWNLSFQSPDREHINKIFFVNDVLIYQLCLILTFAAVPPWGGNRDHCAQLKFFLPNISNWIPSGKATFLFIHCFSSQPFHLFQRFQLNTCDWQIFTIFLVYRCKNRLSNF